jgi:rRNA-processing protein FCF1
MDKDDKNLLYTVDSHLLALSLQYKCPLATIDKILMKRALRRGTDIITLKNNKIIFVNSNIKSNQI